MEKIRTLNQLSGLTGLITEPASNRVRGGSFTDRQTRTAALIFADVSGHRSGTSRLNTDLCRLLAKNGYLTIRYSAPEMDRTNALLDAMSCLASNHGADKFVIFASRPESEYVLELAEQDPRIKGLHLTDVTAIKNQEFYFYKLCLFAPRRVFQIKQWHAWMATLKHSLFPGHLDHKEHYQTDFDSSELLSLPRLSSNELRYLLWSLFRKETSMHFVYTGSSQHFYNHSGQFDTMTAELGRSQRATSSFLARADHWLIHNDERLRVIDQTLSWVCSHFPPEESHDMRDAA